MKSNKFSKWFIVVVILVFRDLFFKSFLWWKMLYLLFWLLFYSNFMKILYDGMQDSHKAYTFSNFGFIWVSASESMRREAYRARWFELLFVSSFKFQNYGFLIIEASKKILCGSFQVWLRDFFCSFVIEWGSLLRLGFLQEINIFKLWNLEYMSVLSY